MDDKETEQTEAAMPRGGRAPIGRDGHRAERTSTPMNLFISRVLRIGVWLSAAVIALGLLLFLATGRTGYEAAVGVGAGGNAGTGASGTAPLNLRELVRFGVKGAFPTSLGELARGVAAFKPFAIIQLGLVLLIATPVVRVAASVVAFGVERDRLYVVITLYVLVVLVVSFLLGRAL